MATKEFEDDDPLEFVAVRYPAEPGTDPEESIARCFIEEYALMGCPRDRIFQMFRSPFFVGTHGIMERRGEAFVRRLIDDVYGPARAEEAS